MIATALFVHALAERGVRLEARGSRLRVTAQKGALTAELRNELADRKGDLLAFLRESRMGPGRSEAAVPQCVKRSRHNSGSRPVFVAGIRGFVLGRMESEIAESDF